MAILDARAQLICNIGPVISGSLSDDHIQEKGLITTNGQLLLQGLHNPAIGSQVFLAYINAAGTTAARFPKPVLRVLSCYADPFTRQTSLEVGCLLTYLSNRSGPATVRRPAIINSRKTSAAKKRHPRTVIGQTMLQFVCNDLGITLNQDVLLNNEYSPDEFEGKDNNYIDLISNLLLTENAYGYIDDQEHLRVKSLEGSLGGPVLSLDQFIDVQATSGGREPAAIAVAKGTVEVIEPVAVEEKQEPTVEPKAVVTKEPPARDQKPTVATVTPRVDSNSWQKAESYNSAQIVLQGETKAGQPYFFVFDYTESSVTKEEFNQDGISLGRITTERRPLVAINSQYVEDFIRHTGREPDGARSLYQSTITEQNSYKVTYDDEGEPIYTQTGQKRTTIRSAAEVLGGLSIKDYAFTTALPDGNIVTEIVQTEYLYNVDSTKTIQNTYRNYSATQVGQQLISKLVQETERPIIGRYRTSQNGPYYPVYGLIPLGTFLSPARQLTWDGRSVDIQSFTPEPEIPKFPTTTKPFEGKVKQEASPADTTSVNEFVFPLKEQQPWTDGTGDTIDISPLVIQAKAEKYAEIQNGLLWAYRYGRQLVTTLNVLPLNPYEPFHVTYNGVTAAFRVNALSYQFDQNECLVSTDALYIGVAGGSIGGAGWLPLPYGTSTLPPAPAVTSHGPQAIANSAAVTTPVNTANQSAINSLISALPTGQTQGFSQTVAPASTITPYRTIPTPVASVRVLASTQVFRGLQTELRAAFVKRIKLTGITGDACDAPISLLSLISSLPPSADQNAVIKVQATAISLASFTPTAAALRTVLEVV